MKQTLPKYPRILAIAPSTRGFGFALVEGHRTLVDWGVKSIKGDKNRGTLLKVKEMVTHYRPDVLALEDVSAKSCRRSARIRTLINQLTQLAKKEKVSAPCFFREQVAKTFFPEGKVTRYDVARKVVEMFSDELGFRLPPKRRPWQSEDSRMDIFDAVALALMVR